MTDKIKILLLFSGLILSVNLTAQILKGELYSLPDSLPIKYAKITAVDSTGNVFAGTTTNKKGEFIIRIANKTQFVKIFKLPDYAELHIINLTQENNDTINLGKLPLIKAPNYLQVQFKGISNKKEKRKQKQLVKAYNKKVKNYKGREVEINSQIVKLTVKRTKDNDSNRLRLIYILSLNEN
jgi:hypothetical protein